MYIRMRILLSITLVSFYGLVVSQEKFKMGLLAPWNGTFEDFSALTSASAVSLAMEAVHSDPTLSSHIQLRSVTQNLDFNILYI